jgi:pimeloyl-ACP methyl ester carboxylesterase
LIADPGCRVILYDRPGTMGSDVAGTLADASEAIHTMLSELGLGPVVVIGQSLGGAVATLLAIDHPEDVAGLVLLDPTPINDPKLAKQAEQTARTTASLSKVPGFAWALSALLRSIAERSAKRHDMSPEARAATLKISEVDLVKLSESATGLEAIASSFDESKLPVVPAAVVTADRKAGSSITAAHRRVSTALDTPLLSWPGAEHQVHLTHQDEVLAASRAVVRTVAAS